MSTLTPVEFIEHCDEEAYDAAAEYRRGTVRMDVPDDDGEVSCARCDLPAEYFPTKCVPLGDGVLTLADTRVYGVQTDGGLTFQWTVCPECSAALAEWVKKTEAPNA